MDIVPWHARRVVSNLLGGEDHDREAALVQVHRFVLGGRQQRLHLAHTPRDTKRHETRDKRQEEEQPRREAAERGGAG